MLDGDTYESGGGWDTISRVYRIEIPPPPEKVVREGGGGYQYTFRLPLTPLTPPRKVLHCAGNILRELSSLEDPTVGTPASRELESAVDRYLKENPQVSPGRKLDIFALITPPGCQAPGNGEVNPWNLQSRQKLRRVLSGGGGWGKKMGLLSIDPQGLAYALSDEEYARLHYADDGVAEEGGEEERFKREFERRFFGAQDDIRGPVAEKGDEENDLHTVLSISSTIQFLLANPAELSPLSTPSPTRAEQSLILGCIHKDSQPLVVDPREEERELARGKGLGGDEVSYEMGRMRKGLQVPGVFGARAEEGLWVHDEGEAGGKDGVVRGGRGKMDVPGGEVVVVVKGVGGE